jgi:hypothetical protein
MRLPKNLIFTAKKWTPHLDKQGSRVKWYDSYVSATRELDAI